MANELEELALQLDLKGLCGKLKWLTDEGRQGLVAIQEAARADVRLLPYLHS